MTHHAEIAEKCLVGFLKNFDISVLDTYSADSFKAIVHPESLEKREREKAEYLKSRAKLAGNFKQCTLFDLVEIFNGGDKVTAHVRFRVALKDGTEWKSDALFIFTFNEKGRVIYLKEFVDSLELFKVAAKLR